MESKESCPEFGLDRSIEEFENRKKYTHFDQQTLYEIPDNDLELAILDYVDYKIGEDYENKHSIVTNLSKGFQAVYTTWWVDAEVNNGGFNQYFWNCGQFAIEAIEGFRVIGARKLSELMKKAVESVIEEIPEMKKYYKLNTPEAFSESYDHTDLNKLDEQYYTLSEDLSVLRIKYIRANPHLFFVKEE